MFGAAGKSGSNVLKWLKRQWKKILFVNIYLVAAFAVFLFLESFCLIDWSEEGADEYPGGIVLRDANGEIMRVSLGPGDIDSRPFYKAQKDDWIVKALVASEDGTFFEHNGVRPLSILRAAWQNLTSRRRVSGASTITMQTVRLIKPHEKTFVAKYVEAVQAVKMECRKDKLWIISQYLNRASFGSNFVGIEAAANGWFGKSPKSLTLAEAALLAGMVQAPSRFRPDKDYNRALRRRDYVLDRMVQLGLASEEQAQAARSVKPELRRHPRPFEYPHYCDYYISRFCRDESGARISRDVITSLNPLIQRFAQSCVSRTASDKGCDVAAVVRRVDSGEIVAMAVSGDYFASEAGQVNTALSPRSAGSTLKPFLAAFAMDLGLVAPGEMLLDIPKTYKGYAPSNFDTRWRGAVSLDDSLVLSLNMPFVRLLEKTGVDRFGALLRTSGFVNIGYDDAKNGLGMAIGNVSVTLDELTFAYSRLARAAQGSQEEPLSPESAYIVSEMLSSSARSMAALGHVADVNAPRFAWKTGTSSAFCDAWTVAWNPEYVIGVWCGHISGKFGDKTITGAEIAAPLAWEIARFVEPGVNPKWFRKPDCVSVRKICTVSGHPVNANCPSSVEAIYSTRTSSARLCEVHRCGFDGKVVEKLDPLLEAFYSRVEKASKLAILQPVDGTKFERVEEFGQQKIVVKVAGNPSSSRLWWFLDGKLIGETLGSDSLVLDMVLGSHNLVCVTAEGVKAEVDYVVE